MKVTITHNILKHFNTMMAQATGKLVSHKNVIGCNYSQYRKMQSQRYSVQQALLYNTKMCAYVRVYACIIGIILILEVLLF